MAGRVNLLRHTLSYTHIYQLKEVNVPKRFIYLCNGKIFEMKKEEKKNATRKLHLFMKYTLSSYSKLILLY